MRIYKLNIVVIIFTFTFLAFFCHHSQADNFVHHFIAGTTLSFDNTVGVLVHGKMYAVASSAQPIIMKRREEDNPYANLTWLRLSGGDNELEGVLEVNVSGEWSTVCNKVSVSN